MNIDLDLSNTNEIQLVNYGQSSGQLFEFSFPAPQIPSPQHGAPGGTSLQLGGEPLPPPPPFPPPFDENSPFKHLEKNGNKIAIIWEADDPNFSKKITKFPLMFVQDFSQMIRCYVFFQNFEQ